MIARSMSPALMANARCSVILAVVLHAPLMSLSSATAEKTNKESLVRLPLGQSLRVKTSVANCLTVCNMNANENVTKVHAAPVRLLQLFLVFVETRSTQLHVEARESRAFRFATRCWIVGSINAKEDAMMDLATHALEIQKE